MTACKALVIAALSLKHKLYQQRKENTFVSHTDNMPCHNQMHKLDLDLAAMRNNNHNLHSDNTFIKGTYSLERAGIFSSHTLFFAKYVPC